MRVIEPGHVYELDAFEGSDKQTLSFINKFNEGTVHDGTTNEEVLAMMIDRLRFLQNKFSCRENAIAITKIEEALLWLNYRTKKRIEQGVEGKDLPHKE